MKRAWAVVPLFIVLVLLFLPKLFLVPSVTRELEAELAAGLHTEALELEIKAPWGWELLLGRIPSLSLAARDASLEGVAVAQVAVEGEEILFQPWTLFRQRELVITRISKLTGSLTITEDALNEMFWREVDPSRRLWLEVLPEGLAVVGTVGLWNMDLSIRVLGDVLVESGSVLGFEVKEVAVQEASLPPQLLEVLAGSFGFTLDLGEFPLPVEVRAVELLDHEIKIQIGGQQ